MMRFNSNRWLLKLWSFLGGTLNIRCRIITGIQKGTIILTTTQMAQMLKMTDDDTDEQEWEISKIMKIHGNHDNHDNQDDSANHQHHEQSQDE